MPRQSRGLKTRNGCAQCKERRIKCDEKKPSCFNCKRLHRECSFQLTEPFLLISRALLQPTLLNSSSHVQSQSKLPQKHRCRDDQSMRSCETTFTLDDMHLLHHFTTHTAATLSDHPETQMLWRTSVVECAFRHPFLLQGILAVTALHFATRNHQEEDRLSMMAASKQNTALHEFRSQLQQITPVNCDALFAFSFLAGYYVPASAGTVINPSANFLKEDLFNAMVYWLRLCRGTSSIYQYAKEWIRQGPLANLFWADPYSENDRHSEVRDESSLHTPYEQRLRDLENLCDQFSGREGVASEMGIEERELNARALRLFIRLFRCLHDQHKLNVLTSENPRSKSPDIEIPGENSNVRKPKLVSDTGKNPSDLTLSLAWLFEIPLGFIDLLEQQRPVSLVIFAHFALLLRHAPQFWWNEPIARKIVKAVSTSLAPRYHQWIQWPIHEVL